MKEGKRNAMGVEERNIFAESLDTPRAEYMNMNSQRGKIIYLKETNLIWFDKYLNLYDEEHGHRAIEDMFCETVYLNELKYLSMEMKNARSPMVFICRSKQYYESEFRIAHIVDRCPYVVFIVLICFDMNHEASLFNGHSKVKCMLENVNKLVGELSPHIPPQCSKYVIGKYFHSLEEQSNILEGASTKSLFFRGESNIGYPLYFGGYSFSQSEWTECLHILGVGGIYGENNIEDVDGDILAQALFCKLESAWKESQQFDLDLKLDVILNRLLEEGNKLGIEYYQLCSFILRGCIFLHGNPVARVAHNNILKPMYRSIVLNTDQLKSWTENKGNVILLSKYITTTSYIRTFTTTPKNKSNYLLKIEFTQDIREIELFQKALDQFNDIWNGIFYPVELSMFSKFKDEFEFLFPPFYPVRVISLEIDPDHGFQIIKLLAPLYVNFGNNYVKDGIKKEGLTKGTVENYFKKVVELMKLKMVNQIDLSGGLVTYANEKDVELIFHECDLQVLLSLNLESTNIRIPTYNQDNIRPDETLIRLSLKNNLIGKDEAVVLGNYLKHYPKLQELDLSDNQIGDIGVIPIAKIFKNIGELKKIYIKNNSITVNGVKSITKKFKYISGLTELDLSKNQMKNKGVEILAKALDFLPLLGKLFISENGITEIGAKVLVAHLKQNKGFLQVIDLENNNLGEMGTALFLDSFDCWPKLKNLSIGSNSRFRREKEIISRIDKSLIYSNPVNDSEYEQITPSQIINENKYEIKGMVAHNKLRYKLMKTNSYEPILTYIKQGMDDQSPPKSTQAALEESKEMITNPHFPIQRAISMRQMPPTYKNKALNYYVTDMMDDQYRSRFLRYEKPKGMYPMNILTQMQETCHNHEMEMARDILRNSPIQDCYRLLTSDSPFVKKLNCSLAMRKFETYDVYMKTILYYEKQMKTFLPTGTTYRGIFLPEQDLRDFYQVNKAYFWTHFVGTSCIEEKARNFMRMGTTGYGCEVPILFKIILDKGVLHNKYYIKEYSCLKKEEEILLMPYFKFKVVKRHEELYDLVNHKIIIEIREIQTNYYGKGLEVTDPLVYPKLSLLWVDPNIYDTNTSKLFNTLEDQLYLKLGKRIYAYEEEGEGKRQVARDKDSNYILITNGSNKETFIRDISLLGNISAIIIFTSRQIVDNGYKIMKNHPKVKGVFCKFSQVVKAVKKYTSDYQSMNIDSQGKCKIF